MIQSVFTIILFVFVLGASSKPSERQRNLEFAIFRANSDFEARSEPETTAASIQELNRIYSSNDEPNIYRGYIEKLAELPHLKDCDDETFVKFDLLNYQSSYRKVDVYILDQKMKMAKRCDEHFKSKFTDTFYGMDEDISKSLEELADRVGLDYSLKYLKSRPLFKKKELVEGIYKFLDEKNKKIAKKEALTKEESDSMFRFYILGPCISLTSDFDRISHFYIRNFLEKETIRYCSDSSKSLTYIAEMCHTIMTDETELSALIYEVILKYHDTPKAYLYNILDQMLIY